MLRVQLCPPQELEDKYWYAVDLTIALIFGFASFFALKTYIDGMQTQIDLFTLEKVSFEKRQESLKPMLEKFKNLDADIAELNRKMDALRAITISKIERIKHVVVLEHLQTLKPTGIWFKSLSLQETGRFELQGSTFDNILVAEFMMTLRDTQEKVDQTQNVRSSVYFSDIKLRKTVYNPTSDVTFADLSKFHNFILEGVVTQRQEAPKLNVATTQ